MPEGRPRRRAGRALTVGRQREDQRSPNLRCARLCPASETTTKHRFSHRHHAQYRVCRNYWVPGLYRAGRLRCSALHPATARAITPPTTAKARRASPMRSHRRRGLRDRWSDRLRASSAMTSAPRPFVLMMLPGGTPATFGPFSQSKINHRQETRVTEPNSHGLERIVIQLHPGQGNPVRHRRSRWLRCHGAESATEHFAPWSEPRRPCLRA